MCMQHTILMCLWWLVTNLVLPCRHAEESLKIIAEERNKRMGSKSSVSSSKSVTTPTVRFCFPLL